MHRLEACATKTIINIVFSFFQKNSYRQQSKKDYDHLGSNNMKYSGGTGFQPVLKNKFTHKRNLNSEKLIFPGS